MTNICLVTKLNKFLQTLNIKLDHDFISIINSKAMNICVSQRQTKKKETKREIASSGFKIIISLHIFFSFIISIYNVLNQHQSSRRLIDEQNMDTLN